MTRSIDGPARGASLAELEAAVTYARERLQLQRRRDLLGRGLPGRRAELERRLENAEGNLRRARAATTTDEGDG
jgi:hypothetical protein